MPSASPDALSSPEALLRDLLAVSLTGVILFRPVFAPEAPATIVDLAYVQLNPAAQRMLQLPECPADTFLTLYPSTVSTGIFAFYCDTFQTGEAGRYDVNYQHDGLDNYFLLAARRSGELLVVSFTDTADHPRTPVEEALRASQAREQAALRAVTQHQAQEREAFHQIFEHTPAAICIHRGPEHRYAYRNAAYEAFFPGRALLGRPLAEALPEAVAGGFVAKHDHVYRTGETHFGHEMPLLLDQPDGRPPKLMYFTFTYQAYRENGEIAGISTFAYDVTEQAQLRQAHEAERLRLLNLFAQAPAGICILAGPALVYEFVNPGYQQLLPGRALQGRPIFEVLPELLGTPIEAMLRGVYATGQAREEQDLLVAVARPEDGALENRYFTFVYQARHDEHGRPDGILVFVFEVSEQVRARQASEASARQARELAEQLATANEQLTRTNVDLDNFIYTASHDLKAPISNIEGLLDILQHELPPPTEAGEIAHILDLMHNSVDRFKRTIEHLTAVSRLQKEHDPPTAQVALAPVIEDVRLDLAPLLHDTGGRLDVDVRRCPPLVFAEKNLRSVVYNLLSNALKYCHPDRPPRVRVRTRQEAGCTVLEVSDNGLGIDLARQDQLFALFQRLHDHVEGSGIGLYMVKRMVENAGGKITVRSQVGEGSCFSVYFPAGPAAPSLLAPD